MTTALQSTRLQNPKGVIVSLTYLQRRSRTTLVLEFVIKRLQPKKALTNFVWWLNHLFGSMSDGKVLFYHNVFPLRRVGYYKATRYTC